MENARPDPDALLAQVKVEAERKRGRLKVFLGAAAGVGKTYAMLEAAHLQQRAATDVVVGVIETHGRAETEALLDGLEVLPRRSIAHGGVTLTEFDLDGALARHPALILVDELAHTNAPGSRHVKRWQDVEELLDAGIDVYAAMNVQHLESLNDVVARITHVRVRETVPDAVLEQADEIELVDLPPGELLQRLREGKVYVPEQATRAAQSFFRKGNLIALRQLALRHLAERVDAQMQVYRRATGVAETWPVRERVLVAVGAAPSSQRLVRATKRMAERLGAEWIAAFVETPAYTSWSEADRSRVWETLRLAEQLGGHTVSVSGTDTATELLSYARTHNVTKLVVGKPAHTRIRDRLLGSLLDNVVRASGDVDVYVISGEPGEEAVPRRVAAPVEDARSGYLWAMLAVVACTLIGSAMRPWFELVNIVMVFLLAITMVAARLGRRPSILASILSVAAFDFFFVPPHLTFAVSDTQYVITFLVMLAVALVISSLTARLKLRSQSARHREQRTAALYEMSRDLGQTPELDRALQTGVRHIAAVFGSDAAVLLPDAQGRLDVAAAAGRPSLDNHELAVARWAFDHRKPAGAGTDTLPSAAALHVPLVAARGAVGVLAVKPASGARLRDPEQLHLLDVFARQIAATIERERLEEETRRARQREDMDRLRTEFVTRASRELRAPLASLASNLDRLDQSLAPECSREDRARLAAASIDLARVRRLADELLDFTALEEGRTALTLKPLSPAQLVQDALQAFTARPGPHPHVDTEVDDDAPAVLVDRERITAVFATLLANAARLAGREGRVTVYADEVRSAVQFSVVDNGQPIPLDEQAAIFDPLTGEADQPVTGLARARQIVRAHGGALWLDSGPGRGNILFLHAARSLTGAAGEASPPPRTLRSDHRSLTPESGARRDDRLRGRQPDFAPRGRKTAGFVHRARPARPCRALAQLRAAYRRAGGGDRRGRRQSRNPAHPRAGRCPIRQCHPGRWRARRSRSPAGDTRGPVR